MAWSINMWEAKCIRSYAEALAFYEKTKPLKDGIHRPLCSRRAQHKVMYMRSGKALAFRLYQTDLVVYHPDGRVEINFHNSVSSNRFVDHFLPSGLSVASRFGCMFITHNGNFYTSGRTLMFERTSRDDWVVTNPEAVRLMTKQVIDRKLAHQARKAVAPFVLWSNIYLRFRPEGPPPTVHFHPDGEIKRHLATNGEIPQERYSSLLRAICVHGKQTASDVKSYLQTVSYDALGVIQIVTLPFGSPPAN